MAEQSNRPPPSFLGTLSGNKPNRARPSSEPRKPSTMQSLANSLAMDTLSSVRNKPRIDTSSLEGALDELALPDESVDGEPYHFCVYAHRHNTHVTFTKPNRDAIVSLSCGNLGFRKAQRKNYDSAYQLAAYVIDRLQQQGWHKKVETLEVVLRGFGPGREAVTKVLMGTEGKLWRPKIVRVTDSTRIKFGGTRSKKPRRLG